MLTFFCTNQTNAYLLGSAELHCIMAASRNLKTGRQTSSHQTVQLFRPAHQNSLPFCVPAILNKASLSQFPPKNDHPLPLFYLPLWSVSCWDRLEPRKRGANWMLILVWVPEMSGASVISAIPLYLLSRIISFSKQQMQVLPIANWFREFSLLMGHEWRSERARCSLLSDWPVFCGVVSSLHSRRETGAYQMLTLAQLKKGSGKRLCLLSDSVVHYQFNAWSRKRLVFLLSPLWPPFWVLVSWMAASQTWKQ